MFGINFLSWFVFSPRILLPLFIFSTYFFLFIYVSIEVCILHHDVENFKWLLRHCTITLFYLCLAEEWVTKKTKELLTTRQIATRVQRQVLLEDGKVLQDSGPLVSTTTNEDTETKEHEHTEVSRYVTHSLYGGYTKVHRFILCRSVVVLLDQRLL